MILTWRIVDLGKRYNKPVVATCDVHFMDPQDEAFLADFDGWQRLYRCGQSSAALFQDNRRNAGGICLFGRETAYQVVVENTNKIADMIDDIQLLPDESHPPHLDGAEEELIEISKKKAHELYGDPLPEIVQKRMDKELHSITTYGYSVLYVIAQKLVWKSLADGYLVGSRGSVGSSFIAFLMGITEVNALQPHYVAPSANTVNLLRTVPSEAAAIWRIKTVRSVARLCIRTDRTYRLKRFWASKGIRNRILI